MNMKTIIASAFLASILFTSCKKELEPQDSAENPVAKTEDASIVPTENIPAPQTAVQQPTLVTTPATTKTLAGMNPPHGEAGHDCAVAVGAPLNSKKATPTPSPTITTTQSNTTSAAPAILNPAAQTVTAPGMNPPHGQAGHDCAVAVGAPLPKA